MRSKTPSFILELPLKVSGKEEKEILSRLESGRQLYNALLGKAKQKVYLVKQSKAFQTARKIPKLKKNKQIRYEEFQKARDQYGFSEHSLQEYACGLRHNLRNNLDIHTVQKLATRAFRATEKILFGTAKHVRFKGYNQFNSLESKSNAAGIRWRNNRIEWNHLSLEPIIKVDDAVIRYGLQHRVKYCRIYRKVIRGRNRFYVQLVLEGKPFIKEKNRLGEGEVFFDFGPSTLAVVSRNKNNEFNARLVQFCSELDTKAKEIAGLQRKIDRQRRQANPKNFTGSDGTGKIKKGRLTWKKSKRQVENEKQLKEIYRVTASHRKSLQGKLINETLRMGNVFGTEKVSRKWLQKSYGKSVGIRAPGMYCLGVKRKAESAGGSFHEFPTVTTKLSQTCVCGRQEKKPLSVRVQDCRCGVYAQRDLFSAYMGLFLEKHETVNETGEKKETCILQTAEAARLWPGADKLLQAVWGSSIQSTTGKAVPSSFGKPKACQSQSRSLASGGEKIIVKFKVQDVVPDPIGIRESLKENKTFPLEPAGF